MNSNSTNDVLILNAPYGANPASTSNFGAKWGIKFVGAVDANLNSNTKTSAIYAVSEDTLGYNRGTSLAFYTNEFNDGTYAERMRVFHNGNVGIGTSGPINKLHLYGTASSTANAGPTLVCTSSEDQYPSLQILPFAHNNVNIAFDMYYSGSDWRNSTASNASFVINKTSTTFNVSSETTSAGAGTVISTFDYNPSFQINNANEIGIGGSATASRTLTINSVAGRPSIRINNADFSTTTRTFTGYIPIDLGGTTRYLAIYS
jgi:hypothetical protein